MATFVMGVLAASNIAIAAIVATAVVGLAIMSIFSYFMDKLRICMALNIIKSLQREAKSKPSIDIKKEIAERVSSDLQKRSIIKSEIDKII